MIDGVKSAAPLTKVKYQQEVAELKTKTIQKYSKAARTNVEAEKAILEKERQRRVDVLCWWFVAGTLVAYFLKLYKL
jgi:predicted nucleic acid-binding Zn ribbon protein